MPRTEPSGAQGGGACDRDTPYTTLFDAEHVVPAGAPSHAELPDAESLKELEGVATAEEAADAVDRASVEAAEAAARAEEAMRVAAEAAERAAQKARNAAEREPATEAPAPNDASVAESSAPPAAPGDDGMGSEAESERVADTSGEAVGSMEPAAANSANVVEEEKGDGVSVPAPVLEDEDDGFGDFGDFGGAAPTADTMGMDPASAAPLEEEEAEAFDSAESIPPSAEDDGFGDFGDFGGAAPTADTMVIATARPPCNGVAHAAVDRDDAFGTFAEPPVGAARVTAVVPHADGGLMSLHGDAFVNAVRARLAGKRIPPRRPYMRPTPAALSPGCMSVYSPVPRREEVPILKKRSTNHSVGLRRCSVCSRHRRRLRRRAAHAAVGAAVVSQRRGERR